MPNFEVSQWFKMIHNLVWKTLSADTAYKQVDNHEMLEHVQDSRLDHGGAHQPAIISIPLPNQTTKH